MFPPGIFGPVGVLQSRTRNTDYQLGRRTCCGDSPVTSHSAQCAAAVCKARSGFTLLELLIVIGIIGLLLVLIAPAFTTIKDGADVTSAAYTIKGVLDTARTYAKANNTYTWVGFLRRMLSSINGTPGTGRLCVNCCVQGWLDHLRSQRNLAQQDLTTGLIQVGKLVKIDNVHLWTHTDSPSGTGSTFPTRRNVAGIYCIGDTTPANSTTPFEYPVGNPAPPAQGTHFEGWIQFSPRGEARVNRQHTQTRTVRKSFSSTDLSRDGLGLNAWTFRARFHSRECFRRSI